ncbi:MAG: hypothetical protein M5U26_27160 [Planctomycetota bacterium]|nr:hypothetical protein [Planctomycetota bacterium]
MRTIRTCFLLALFALAAAGARAEEKNRIPEAVQAALEKAESFTLYSLDPREREEKPKDAFHGYAVLGQTEVKEAETRKELLAAFKKGVEENQGEMAKCFEPRHGIRVKDGETTHDLVICFECLQVLSYRDAKEEREQHFLVSASPQPAFDAVLKAAGVKLAPKPGE